ncbi:hypothetical protein LSM04_002342 [Trypanosoma melophagium]|uniref:uncharacterized protein n=1 Tax=Trypanosoma melophagium TaxID=715481 RepID=UPI00351AA406|nr:hypothetical protein LSM04_002342 [Trypanosoma melophagium]
MSLCKVNVPLAVVLLLSFLPYGGVALPRCRTIGALRGINYRALLDSNESYYSNEEYFCAATAPAQYHCGCSFSNTCLQKNDPWGRNIGVCGCCPWWLTAFFTFFAIFFLLSLAMGVYFWCCRGRWWCDGYPPPVQPLMCRRRPAIVAPAAAPLPPSLFRGYPAEAFVSDDPPTTGNNDNNGNNTRGTTPQRLVGGSGNSGNVLLRRREGWRRGREGLQEVQTPPPMTGPTSSPRLEMPPELQSGLSQRSVVSYFSREREEL